MEQIDVLPKGLKIIQDSQMFKYGIDAVLLSDFAKDKIKRDFRVCDLCSGNGIVPILLCGATKVCKILGVEIQKECVNLAQKSVKLNNLDEKIDFIAEDLKKLSTNQPFLQKTFDVVTVNPPYAKIDSGTKNIQNSLCVARHEILCDLNDVIKSAKFLLKDKGTLFMIHRSLRLNDIFSALFQQKIGAKSIRFVYGNANDKKNATMVLIEAKNNFAGEVIVLPPLFVYKDKGVYSDEMKEILLG